eukprot:3352448-Lingulodinium_polyedra.AAC.1
MPECRGCCGCRGPPGCLLHSAFGLPWPACVALPDVRATRGSRGLGSPWPDRPVPADGSTSNAASRSSTT